MTPHAPKAAPAACNVALAVETCLAGLGREAGLWAFGLATDAGFADAIRRVADRLRDAADACHAPG